MEKLVKKILSRGSSLCKCIEAWKAWPVWEHWEIICNWSVSLFLHLRPSFTSQYKELFFFKINSATSLLVWHFSHYFMEYVSSITLLYLLNFFMGFFGGSDGKESTDLLICRTYMLGINSHGSKKKSLPIVMEEEILSYPTRFFQLV